MNANFQSPNNNTNQQEKGQAIIIIALGFVVLLGFVGLVVDVAHVFVARGQLRRAVDSAGLAAAAQFRQNASTTDIQNAATQFLYAHGLIPDAAQFSDIAVDKSTIAVDTCNTSPGDATLCTSPLRRKLIRVNVEADVSMIFLQILGVRNVRISANSISEAASVDVVLVLDTSGSQANDAPSMEAYNGRTDLGCGPSSFGVIGEDYAANTNQCIKLCNDTRTCQPFEQVKDAAKAFIDQLYQDYDRVAVVRIDRNSAINLTVWDLSTDLSGAKAAIDNMRVNDHFPRADQNPGDPCPFYNIGGERWKCTTSNMGGALRNATSQFRTTPYRDDSLWAVIVLGSGGADVTDPYPSSDVDSAQFGFCPDKDNLPYCRDNRWSTHHISTTAEYDAEDYAYDKANYLGVSPEIKSVPGLPDGGVGALIFSIGLGQKVVCTAEPIDHFIKGPPGPPVTCNVTPGNPYVDPDQIYPDGHTYPSGAESFLRYLAFLGYQNDPSKEDPCATAALGAQCGNYYYAPDASGLRDIFLTIAGKIFTRLSG